MTICTCVGQTTANRESFLLLPAARVQDVVNLLLDQHTSDTPHSRLARTHMREHVRATHACVELVLNNTVFKVTAIFFKQQLVVV